MISSKFEAKTGIGSSKNPAEQGLFASARYRRSMFVRYRRSMFVITIDSNRVRRQQWKARQQDSVISM
jgi:hypothetical protein